MQHEYNLREFCLEDKYNKNAQELTLSFFV